MHLQCPIDCLVQIFILYIYKLLKKVINYSKGQYSMLKKNKVNSEEVIEAAKKKRYTLR